MKSLLKVLVSVLLCAALLCGTLTALAAVTPQIEDEYIYLTCRDAKQKVDLKQYISRNAELQSKILSVNPSGKKASVEISDNHVLQIPGGFIGIIRCSMDITKSGVTERKYAEIYVQPAQTSISSLGSSKNGAASITWKKLNHVSYYEVQISEDRSFTSYETRSTSGNVNKITVRGLNPTQTYFFRVVAVKKLDNGFTLCGKASRSSSVKIYPQYLTESFQVFMQGRRGNLDGKTISVELGEVLSLRAANFRPARASLKTVTWYSSDSSVAAVTANGVCKTRSRGETTLIVEAADGSGASCIFTLVVE